MASIEEGGDKSLNSEEEELAKISPEWSTLISQLGLSYVLSQIHSFVSNYVCYKTNKPGWPA